MRIAYLVLAHTNPVVLGRSIRRLSSHDSAFFIHIDKKSDLASFEHLAGKNVHFVEPRIRVYWGEFSLVQATLLLLRKSFEATPPFDYFVLLSGSDYPIRSVGYISSFFEKYRGLEFMNLVRVPAPGKPLSRINTLRFPSHKPLRRFVARTLAKFGLAVRDYRKHFDGMEPYSGSQWWALSRNAAQYIFDFIERKPHFVRFFENTFASDEAFFQTILANSPLKSRIRRNLHYENWPATGGHPAMIDDDDIFRFEKNQEVSLNDSFGAGELLFARKFSDNRFDLLEKIDRIIDKKEGPHEEAALTNLRRDYQ